MIHKGRHSSALAKDDHSQNFSSFFFIFLTTRRTFTMRRMTFFFGWLASAVGCAPAVLLLVLLLSLLSPPPPPLLTHPVGGTRGGKPISICASARGGVPSRAARGVRKLLSTLCSLPLKLTSAGNDDDDDKDDGDVSIAPNSCTEWLSATSTRCSMLLALAILPSAPILGGPLLISCLPHLALPQSGSSGGPALGKRVCCTLERGERVPLRSLSGVSLSG